MLTQVQVIGGPCAGMTSHAPWKLQVSILHVPCTYAPRLPFTMADTATNTGADVPGDETPTQRQARLRREKRQKKMTEQGEDRLAKIKALNGGVAPPEEVLGGREFTDRRHQQHSW